MFKIPLTTMAFAIASAWAFANDLSTENADLIIEISDLTTPNYNLPASTRVISEANIIQGGFSSIVEVLESYSSFRASTDSTGAKRSTAIDFRGFGETAAQNIRVLVDEVPLNNPTLEAANLGLIPLASIRKIEIIPSGAGVLFGNGAVGGVIRITTKNDPQELRSIYSATMGSWGLIDASTLHTLPLQNSSLTGEITKQSSDGYRHFNDSNLSYGKLTYRVRSEYDFSISHARSLDQRNAAGASLPSIISMDRRDSDIDDRSSIDYRQAITTVAYGTAQRDLNSRVQLSHRQSDQIGIYANPSYGAIAQNLDVVNLKAELSSKPSVTKNTWLTGVELGGGGYNSLYNSDRRSQSHAALYGQRSLPLDETLDLSLGARYQWLKDSMGNNFNAENALSAFDLSLRKTVNTFTVTARIDQNFRYATLDEQSKSGAALEPQKGQGLDLTLEHPRGGISLWLLNNKNEILFDPTDRSQTTFGSNINVDKTTRSGALVKLNIAVSDSTILQAQAAYVDALIEGGNFKGSAMPGVSPWQAGLVFRTQWSDRLYSQISHRWNSSTHAVTDYDNTLGRHNSFTTTSLGTTYQADSWLLSMGIRNLFDVDRDAYVYDDYGTLKRTPAEPLAITLTFRYVPE
jgi:iron complex outermembrane recepter protein